jgi:transposase
VRRRARAPRDRLNIIGIDDWARRRNHSYGTIVCDLERRRPVTLLPDREPATAAAWLAGNISRWEKLAAGRPPSAKRQMYGRAKIDLLQARLIGAT